MITALATIATVMLMVTAAMTGNFSYDNRIGAWAVFLWGATVTLALYGAALWIEYADQAH